MEKREDGEARGVLDDEDEVLSERCQMVRLACWHSATSERCFQTRLKYQDTGAGQLGINEYGSICTNPK